MPLLPWQRNKEDDNKIEITLPDADQKKIDAAATAAAELPEIKKRLEGLDSIQAYIEEQKKEREEAKKAADAKAAADAQGKNDDELEELFLTDPKTAINKATEPQQKLLLTLRADQIKREVFEDVDKFKYYHGSVKSEVDKLLAGQSLAARNDPSVVENCYLTVVGRHHDEIMEGKIKSRFAGSEAGSRGTSSGSAGSSGTGSRENRTIPDDIKRIAKQFGMEPEAYADMLDKEGIGYA